MDRAAGIIASSILSLVMAGIPTKPSPQPAGSPLPVAAPQGTGQASPAPATWVPLWAAVVTGVFGLAGYVIAGLFLLKSKKLELQVTKAEMSEQELATAFYDQLLERFGFSADSIEVSVEITSLQGEAVVSRAWKGIRMEAGVTVASIPMEASVASPQGCLLHESFEHRYRATGGAPFPKPVEFSSAAQEPKRSMFRAYVEGALSESDPRLDLHESFGMSSAYAMSAEELAGGKEASRFRHEYHAIIIPFPTNRLVLEIRFPVGFAPEPFAGAFFGVSESLHSLELQRISGGLERIPRGARLTVESPLIGFSYLIYWDPPRRTTAAPAAPDPPNLGNGVGSAKVEEGGLEEEAGPRRPSETLTASPEGPSIKLQGGTP